jgi:hypothetical protein
LPVEEEDYVHNSVGFPQSMHLIHLWFTYEIVGSILTLPTHVKKVSQLSGRKSWALSGCSGFLPQELTGWVRISISIAQIYMWIWSYALYIKYYAYL